MSSFSIVSMSITHIPFHLVTPILAKIDPVAVIRIKANLSLATKEVEIGGLHIDVEDEDTPDSVRTSILLHEY